MWLYGAIGFLVLFLLMLVVAFPLGLAMLLVGLCGLMCLSSLNGALEFLGRHVVNTFANYDMAMLATFVLMGELAHVAGMGTLAYEAIYRSLGRMRGVLGISTVLGCAGFAAICGSAPATAATIGSLALPEMKRYGYPPSLAGAIVTAGGTLGILIPPSLGFILYGMLTGESIGSLYLAGIVPGVLGAMLYALTCWVLAWQKKVPIHGVTGTLRERLRAIGGLLPIAIVFVTVIGGLAKGLFSPTVAGAVGSAGVFVIALIQKRLNFEKMMLALENTIQTVGFIMFIYVGALIFNYFLAGTGLPIYLQGMLTSMGLSAKVLVIFILVIWFVLGCVMDEVGMMLLTLPLFYPIAKGMGVDGLWFAVLAVRSIEVGMVTPPIGINIYVVQGLDPEIDLSELYKMLVPFVLADIVGIIILFLFPEICLFLPKLLGGR